MARACLILSVCIVREIGIAEPELGVLLMLLEIQRFPVQCSILWDCEELPASAAQCRTDLRLGVRGERISEKEARVT